jgi:hypothetical protein
MSASPVARQAHSHAQLIPAMRKVLISDASQMPDVYSSTPNGTIYSTTPGGKDQVMQIFVCRTKNNSSDLVPKKYFFFTFFLQSFNLQKYFFLNFF